MLLAYLVYYLISRSARFSICAKIKDKLRKALFFNAPLRYMITANLQLCMSFFSFLLSVYNWQEGFNLGMNAFYLMVSLVLILWPVFIIVLLTKLYDRLEDQPIKDKFTSIIQGLRTSSVSRVLYTPVFHTRRIMIVLTNVMFTKNVILTGFDRDHPFMKIIGFLLVQTLYLIYIIETMPHADHTFNRLELFNEITMSILAYVMIGILYESMYKDEKVELFLVVVTFLIGILILLVNFGTMIQKSVGKTIRNMKLKKAKKEMEQRIKRRQEKRKGYKKKALSENKTMDMSEKSIDQKPRKKDKKPRVQDEAEVVQEAE